jgi:hypothetical protein
MGEDARPPSCGAYEKKSLREGGSFVAQIRNSNLGFGLRRVFLFGVLAAKALYAAGRIQQFLLAGEERMAIGTNFHVDVASMCRAGVKTVAARAHDADFVINGMNGCFHDLYASVPNHSILTDSLRIQQISNCR